MELKSTNDFQRNIKRILITEDEIKSAVKKAGEMINSSYNEKPILLLSILKGSFIFLADLCREITVPCEIGFMAAKSYFEDTQSSGIVNVTMDIQQDISKYHVIIVEDIVDTGRTLYDIEKLIKSRNPISLKVITLLDKPDRRIVNFKTDYSLFTIPDVFVVGYGLDYGEYYRNLPYIAEFKE